MDKSEDAFRTISEAAEELDLPQHVLRFWETRFPQIRPLKRGGGRRYYRPDDVELLRTIRHLLYNEGYTIRGVQRMLKERGVRAVLAMRAEASNGPPVAAMTAASASSVAASGGSVPLDLLPEQVGGAGAALEFAQAAAEHAAPVHVRAYSGVQQHSPHTSAAAMSPTPARGGASVWTLEQRRALDAIAAEIAECRRILGAANI